MPSPLSLATVPVCSNHVHQQPPVILRVQPCSARLMSCSTAGPVFGAVGGSAVRKGRPRRQPLEFLYESF